MPLSIVLVTETDVWTVNDVLINWELVNEADPCDPWILGNTDWLARYSNERWVTGERRPTVDDKQTRPDLAERRVREAEIRIS